MATEIDDAFGLEQTAPIDPITGKPLNAEDVDELIDSYDRTKARIDRLRAYEKNLRSALFCHSEEGEGKTRYVRGQRRRVKLIMPSTTWNQSILKEAYNSYPHLRDEFLAIAKLRVKLVEFNKMKNETGPADFETFRAMILKADQGAPGLPSVNIEQ